MSTFTINICSFEEAYESDDAILALLRACFPESELVELTDSVGFFRESDVRFLLLERNNAAHTLLGVAMLVLVAPTHAALCNLAVAKAERGRGLGTALLHAARVRRGSVGITVGMATKNRGVHARGRRWRPRTAGAGSSDRSRWPTPVRRRSTSDWALSVTSRGPFHRLSAQRWR